MAARRPVPHSNRPQPHRPGLFKLRMWPYTALALLLACTRAQGYAIVLLTKCEKNLEEGVSLMTTTAVRDNNATLTVRRARDRSLVRDGGMYVRGEQMVITFEWEGISDPGMQVIMEAKGALFKGGSCGGKRVTPDEINGTAVLLLPSNGSSDVHVWGGFASVNTNLRVHLTRTFRLKGDGGKSLKGPPAR